VTPDPSAPSTGPPPEATRISARFALLTALAGLAAAAILFLFVANNLGSGGSDSDVSTESDADLFVAGQAARLSAAVAEDGPLLLPDLLGGSRDIYLQHLGGDDWRAFEARPPGAAERCVLQWDAAPRQFSDSCSAATYPADGTGLVTYPARVDRDGRVVVDLRDPQSPTSTSPLAGSLPPVSAPPS
jgi:hypothetical protein